MLKWINSNWFDKSFLMVCGMLFILFALCFIFVGGYILLLFISEILNL